MRILILPTISKKSLESESCFIVFHQIARAMPQHFFYFVVGRSADTSGLKLPNMEFLRVEGNVEYNTIHTNWPSEIDKHFHRMYGNWPVDLIFTSRSPLGATLKQKMTNIRSKANIPVFVFVTKALGKNESHDQLFDTDLHLRGLTFSECHTMYLTEYERQISLDSMRGHFSPVAISQAMDNGRIICQGMDVNRIENVIKGVPKNEKPTLFFGGRLVGNKRWEGIVKLYWDIRAFSGGNYQIDVVSPGGDTRLGGTSLGSQVARTINLHTDLSQEEAWKKMAAAHVAMSWSQFEGLPIGFVEQIVCGLILICVRRPWSEATFGKKYPFFFETEDEARVLLKWSCNHLHKAQEKMKPYRELVIEKYGITTTASVLDNWFKQHIVGTYFTTLPTTDLKNTYVRLPETFTLDEFVEEMLKYKPGYAQGLCQEYVSTASAELTRRDVRHWLQNSAEDLQDGPLPKFRKMK